MSIRFFRCLPTVKQGNLAQQIARALNKLPDKIAFVNMGGGCHPPPPRSYAPADAHINVMDDNMLFFNFPTAGFGR